MKKFIIFFLILFSSCNQSDYINNEYNNFESELYDLPALRNNSSFSQPYRILETTINDKSLFDKKYGNLQISIGYVLRYYFYTAIKLDSKKNKLISMDQRSFDLPNSNDPQSVVKAAILEISQMSIGSNENEDFITKYYENCIDLSKVNESCSKTNLYEPVCGCDGFTYNSSDEAECKGIQTYEQGKCN